MYVECVAITAIVCYTVLLVLLPRMNIYCGAIHGVVIQSGE